MPEVEANWGLDFEAGARPEPVPLGEGARDSLTRVARERDRQRLASPKLTLRQKARIRADQERADASLPAE